MPLCRSAGLAFLLVSFSASAGSVSVTNGMKKIRANDPAVAQGITAVSIEAAKNEFESFQIVVRGPATQVTARATSLTGPNGSTISAATCGIPGNIRLYQERFLNIGTQLGTLAQGTCSTAPIPPPLSDKLGQGGLVPDPLIPQVDEFDNQCRNFAFDVDANQNRTIYVEVFVPATARLQESIPAKSTYPGPIRRSAAASASRQFKCNSMFSTSCSKARLRSAPTSAAASMAA